MNNGEIVICLDGTDFRDNKVTVVLKKDGKSFGYVKLYMTMLENNMKLCEKYIINKFLSAKAKA
jgi:hypothetical protein